MNLSNRGWYQTFFFFFRTDAEFPLVLFDGIGAVVSVIVTETDASRDCIPVSEASFGHGIVSGRAKWIAAKDAPYCQNGSDYEATFLICLKGIGRAGRREPTCGMRFQS